VDRAQPVPRVQQIPQPLYRGTSLIRERSPPWDPRHMPTVGSPPWDPRHIPTVGSQGGAYGRVLGGWFFV